MKREYTVYWYRLSNHSNPYSDGYIGITNDLNRRHNEHMRGKKGTHFYNAVHKYGKESILKEVLHENVTIEEANELEYQYRPSTNIGWNSAEGGIDTLASVQRTPISLYHKDSYVIVHSFESIYEAANALGIEEGRIRQAKSRNTQVYGYDGWALLLDTDTDRSITLTISEHRSKVLSGVHKTKPSMYKGVTDRWSEADKKRIGDQHRGKTISAEQRAIVSKKNRASHTSCKAISLTHSSEPTTVHSFHSISEASRQLDIPISRLKSKAQRPLNRIGRDGWSITDLGSE